jgi:hypothetical protein
LCCFQAARWQLLEQYLAAWQLLHLPLLPWTRLASEGPEKDMQAGFVAGAGVRKAGQCPPHCKQLLLQL